MFCVERRLKRGVSHRLHGPGGIADCPHGECSSPQPQAKVPALVDEVEAISRRLPEIGRENRGFAERRVQVEEEDASPLVRLYLADWIGHRR